MASMNLNTEELPEPEYMDLGLLPRNRYRCEIVESDTAVPKTGRGEALNLTMEVMEGAFTGRKIWDNILYSHPSENAQKIGQRQIKSICNAVGFAGQLEDSTQLHGVPLMVRVGVEKDPKGVYADKNVVKSYSPVEGAQATNAPAPRQAAPAARQTAPAARQSAPAAAATGRGAPAFMNRR